MSDQPFNDPTAPRDTTPPPPPPPPPAAPVPSAAPPPPAYQPPAQPPQAYQPPAPPPQGYAPQGYAPQGYGAPASGGQPLSAPEAKQWGMLAHIGGIILGFLGPLIVMLVFGPRDAFTRAHSVEALNFQITLIVGYIATFILTFILPIPLTFFVWVAGLVLAIMAGLAANKGENYTYPFSLRLVK